MESRKLSFDSKETHCSGLFYESVNSNGSKAYDSRGRRSTVGCTSQACIVMAHGFAGIKEMRLQAYARRFCQAGYHVLMFDYRHFGESGGEPRQLLDIEKQHEDWRAAIAYARSIDGVDPNKIIIWGSSFSGGHVLKIAAEDKAIAAIISQVPHFSGLASGLSGGILHAAQLTVAGLFDQVGAICGLSPYYIDAIGLPGDLAVLNSEGEYQGYMSLLPREHQYRNEVAARVCLHAVRYSPGKYLKKIVAPVLVQVGLNDKTTPAAATLRACAYSTNKHVVIKKYNLGHFDVYVDPGFKVIINDQIAFLDRIFSAK